MDFTFLLALALSSVIEHADSTSILPKQIGLKYIPNHRPLDLEECADIIITEREGNLSSPNYPRGYPNHISCSWHITGDIGEVITIMFHDIDIEESGKCEISPCCVFNWLKIGPSFNGTQQYVQYCGQGHTFRHIFVSTTNKVWIKFHISSVQIGGRGFKLSFSVGPKKSSHCDIHDFRCSNGICVPQKVRCNGFNECSDGSDEEFCSAYCPTGRSCQSVMFCYDEKKRCNGVADCRDFSDEMGCGSCSANETLCGGGSDQCYNPLIQRCNRIMDCPNGADEKECLDRCPGQIMCSSGVGCYLPEQHCNGIAQCGDSSDEKNCGPDLCNYERGGFLCGNGHCIREEWKCDHTNDCGDGTDEYNCLRNSVLTAAIMGSLICALLLVIAISCTCRLYALRALESRMSNRENMSRMSPEFLFREPPPSYAVAVGEHQRGLCVENVHYNPCPRRGRRRTRRARRHPEARRPSVSLLDNLVHHNRTMQGPPLNFPFPCLPVVPTPADRSPSPDIPQTSSDFTSTTTCMSITSGSEAECWDTGQTIQERLQPANTDTLNGHSGDANIESDKDKRSSEELPTNAESSFSELPMVHKKEKCKDTIEIKWDSSPVHNQSVDDAFSVTSFQTGSTVVVVPDSNETNISGSQESQNSSNYCDNDMQPLIT